jgi:hypothetical protein
MNLMKNPKMVQSTLLLGAALSVLTACDPVPRRELTPEEKQADMAWLYSKFGANYAPLDYKSELYGIDYAALKTDFTARAAATSNNQEFYNLMYEFVATFKDAHTSMSLAPSYMPGREKVAFLGFTGRRQGNNFLVTELFPTVQSANYPVPVGTTITKINGVDLPTYIKETASKYLNLGQDDSNLTVLMPRLFAQLSVDGPLPTDANITLTINDGMGEREVTLPWVTKSFDVFQKEQEEAAAPQDPYYSAEKANSTLLVKDGNESFPIRLIGFDNMPFALLNEVREGGAKLLRDLVGPQGFRVNRAMTWTAKPFASLNIRAQEGAESNKQYFQEVMPQIRAIQPQAIWLDSFVWPAYVFPVRNAEGRIEKFSAYVYVHSFSVGGDGAADMKNILAQAQSFGVQDVLIDTIDNGGGSLVLLSELAQALSNKKVLQPGIQYGLNDSWLDSFEQMAMNTSGTSDIERETFRRILVELEDYKAQGLRISPKESAYSVETLVPWSQALKPNAFLPNFNYVLLTNEMCASACDIFAGVFQDNKMGTIVGARTMGAGGNVVNYWQAPNSNADVRQTESLLVRSNGQYIENVGVTPEVQIPVNEYAGSLYSEAIAKGIEVLNAMPRPAPLAPPAAPTPAATPAAATR